MTHNKSERTLLAILALEPEDGGTSEKDVQVFAAGPLPPLDTRAGMYLRAMQSGDAGAQNYAYARDRILTAMIADLADDAGDDGEERGVSFLDKVTASADRPRMASPSAFRRMAAVLSGLSAQRMVAFAAMTGALLICGWTGAWFYALNSFTTTIAEWRDWEGKSGRQYSCASEAAGGYPFRVELMCAGPAATIVTNDRKFIVEATMLQVAADVLHPNVIVSTIEGPVSVAELNRPDAFIGSWSHAQATVHGPHPTLEGVSIELSDLKLQQISYGGTGPVVSAEHFAFHARLNRAQKQAPAYDLTADIAGAIFPFGPPIASLPWAATIKAVLHGVGDLTPKPLPARIQEWQRSGGHIAMTNLDFHGSSATAKAQGIIALSASGGLHGTLELSGEEYDRLFEAFTGKNRASGARDQLVADEDGSRQVATRSLRAGDAESKPPRAGKNPTPPPPETALSSQSRRLPTIRFADGAAYFDSVALGRIPPFF